MRTSTTFLFFLHHIATQGWCLQRRWYCWFSVLVLDCILQQKTQSTKSVWKGRNVFSKRIWMKQAAYHFRRDYDLHAATSNSLFVVSRQIVAFRRKKYCRHNNLMTGVLWRTLRSKITSRIFWFCKKVILVGGISLFEGSRVDIYFQ